MTPCSAGLSRQQFEISTSSYMIAYQYLTIFFSELNIHYSNSFRSVGFFAALVSLSSPVVEVIVTELSEDVDKERESFCSGDAADFGQKRPNGSTAKHCLHSLETELPPSHPQQPCCAAHRVYRPPARFVKQGPKHSCARHIWRWRRGTDERRDSNVDRPKNLATKVVAFACAAALSIHWMHGRSTQLLLHPFLKDDLLSVSCKIAA